LQTSSPKAKQAIFGSLLSKKSAVQKRRAKAIAGVADLDHPPMPSGAAFDTFRQRRNETDPYAVINGFQDKGRAECRSSASRTARGGKGRAAA